MKFTRIIGAAVVATALLAGAGCSADSDAATTPAGPQPLVGLFRITAGTVDGQNVSGSWFRMVQPGGTPAAGPYMPNGDSPVPGGGATLLEPGTEGGLRVGGYQSEPQPGFADGNSLAASIMKPTKFFGVEFATSTNAIDPQTQNPAAAPSVTDEGGKLTADLSAWAASWNNQEFNQGAPKPPQRTGAQVAGAAQVKQAWDWVSKTWLKLPEKTESEGPPATGTYDADAKKYTLEWTSLIVGGPFNGFTGVWHLEGTFEPGDAAPASVR
ncbi:hypothetical protein [Antrihabitans cavernicola]|uniref:Lipoprotein n=1 Tax=Antrihabitans cavernicola TaxID=2495913 RepID=A0A5A7SDQ2_9NOCA|nr:hypothetical protein [Spelaeibacter cavernicola]KAA0022713.1 hypothetical protein FOY51_13625 [Spelaeibacter cavernicola]